MRRNVPGIPFDRFIVHDWRNDVVKIGEVDGAYLSDISEGLWTEPIAVEVNRLVMDGRYDLILSIGQVVPHELSEWRTIQRISLSASAAAK